jgi:hypothetical protein
MSSGSFFTTTGSGTGSFLMTGAGGGLTAVLFNDGMLLVAKVRCFSMVDTKRALDGRIFRGGIEGGGEVGAGGLTGSSPLLGSFSGTDLQIKSKVDTFQKHKTVISYFWPHTGSKNLT